METVAEAYKRLAEWTDALKYVVENSREEIDQTLAGRTKLPDNCPSRASMAELVFRDVKSKIREVNAAAQAVEKAMFHHHGEERGAGR